MARIRTKNDLMQYIRTQLGEPIINVEVTPEQMCNIIDDSIQKFTEYAYGTLEHAVIVNINGRGDYEVPYLITNIIKLSKGSTSGMNFSSNYGEGLVPDMWSEQYFSSGTSGIGNILSSIIPIQNTIAITDKYFGDDLDYNFNYNRKVIQVLDDYSGSAVLHYNYEYVAAEQDHIFNHEWIKDYCTAKTRYIWGSNTGKFSQQLLGGATINYSDMKSEAMSEIDRLNDELVNKWSDSCPILIG